MASIRKRGQKWQVQVRRQGLSGWSRSFLQKGDAERWARHMEAEADRHGVPADLRALRSITVALIIERYRDTVTVTKRGRTNETIILNALLRQPFASMSLAGITPEVFTVYRDSRIREVKSTTICRELSLLQHAFELARREWGIPITENPLKGIRRPRADKPRDRRLHNGELERLLQNCRQSRTPYLRPLLLLAIETGMRRGELINIRWEDIDFERRTLHIPLTKNGHPRTIPLTQRAAALLQAVPRDSEKVFPTTANAVRLAWTRLVRRACIDGLHFHDLRHEAVSRFFELGLHIAEVALISGHRDYRQLFRYTHLRAEDVAKKL